MLFLQKNIGKIPLKINPFFIFPNSKISINNRIFSNFQNILKIRKNTIINNINILYKLFLIFVKFKNYRDSFQNFYMRNSSAYQIKVYVIRLYLKGIGYKFLRSKRFNSFLRIELGYSISIYLRIPRFIKLSTKRDKIIILGSNYFNVNTFSKRIFNLRPADVYKGKGVRYSNVRYTSFKPGKQRL